MNTHARCGSSEFRLSSSEEDSDEEFQNFNSRTQRMQRVPEAVLHQQRQSTALAHPLIGPQPSKLYAINGAGIQGLGPSQVHPYNEDSDEEFAVIEQSQQQKFIEKIPLANVSNAQSPPHAQQQRHHHQQQQKIRRLTPPNIHPHSANLAEDSDEELIFHGAESTRQSSAGSPLYPQLHSNQRTSSDPCHFQVPELRPPIRRCVNANALVVHQEPRAVHHHSPEEPGVGGNEVFRLDSTSDLNATNESTQRPSGRGDSWERVRMSESASSQSSVCSRNAGGEQRRRSQAMSDDTCSSNGSCSVQSVGSETGDAHHSGTDQEPTHASLSRASGSAHRPSWGQATSSYTTHQVEVDSTVQMGGAAPNTHRDARVASPPRPRGSPQPAPHPLALSPWVRLGEIEALVRTPSGRCTAGPPGTPVCRICYGESSVDNPLVQLGCACKGDLSRIHDECMKTWFGHSGKKHCELCMQDIEALSGMKTPPRREPGHGQLDVPWYQTTEFLSYAVSCSGCCVTFLVVFLGFAAVVFASDLWPTTSNSTSLMLQLLLPLWFFMALIAFYAMAKRLLLMWYNRMLSQALVNQMERELAAAQNAADQGHLEPDERPTMATQGTSVAGSFAVEVLSMNSPNQSHPIDSNASITNSRDNLQGTLVRDFGPASESEYVDNIYGDEGGHLREALRRSVEDSLMVQEFSATDFDLESPNRNTGGVLRPPRSAWIG